jgi:hypothetical protein
MNTWNGIWNEKGHRYMAVELLGGDSYLVRCERCSGWGMIDDRSKEHRVPMPGGIGWGGELVTEYEQIPCPVCGGLGKRKARILVESDDEVTQPHTP